MLVFAAAVILQVSSREVTFKGAGAFEMQGTLLLPANAKSAPALLLLPGSGPTDRDDNIPQMGLKTDVLKQIAERLAQEGVATLRFDKRAVLFNQTRWPKDINALGPFFSWENHITDAKGAFDFLSSQPEIDSQRVGVLGHSEGALIALKLASDPANHVHGLVMAAGQGRPLDVVLMQQLKEKLPQQLPAAIVPKYLDYSKKALNQLKKDGTVPPNAPAGLQSIFNPTTLIFLRQNMQDNPTKLALSYGGDVLVVNGQFDNQVSPEKDAKALDGAFKKRKTGSVELALIPGASHAFKATPTREADAMEGPMVPAALDAIANWCKTHLK